MSPKILLLDLDDTLLGTRKLRLKAKFIARYLKLMKKQHYRYYDAMEFFFRLEAALKQVDPERTNAKRLSHAVMDHLGMKHEDLAQTWIQTLITDIFEGLRQDFHVLPEAHRFIEWAERSGRYRLILATNPVWPLEIVLKRMEWGKLDPKKFDVITHSGIMHACKPSAEYYRELLRGIQVKPQDCLMVGDSWVNDGAALKAGIPVFLLNKKTFPSFDAKRGVYKGSHQALSQFLDRKAKEAR